MWLTRLALKNPIFILMMSLAVIALGWVSLGRLPVDLFPSIDVPQIRVATFYPGAGPQDVEKSITVPMERAVSATPGVDRVESVSRQGTSLVTVWFQYGVNLDNAQFEVAQRIAQIQNTLPPGVNQPFLFKFDVSNIPAVQIAMSGEGLDEKQLYDIAYNVVEPQLERGLEVHPRLPRELRRAQRLEQRLGVRAAVRALQPLAQRVGRRGHQREPGRHRRVPQAAVEGVGVEVARQHDRALFVAQRVHEHAYLRGPVPARAVHLEVRGHRHERPLGPQDLGHQRHVAPDHALEIELQRLGARQRDDARLADRPP